jgi:hypothetical protein
MLKRVPSIFWVLVFTFCSLSVMGIAFRAAFVSADTSAVVSPLERMESAPPPKASLESVERTPDPQEGGEPLLRSPLAVESTGPPDVESDGLEPLLNELRRLASHERYHAPAWPTVEAIARCVARAKERDRSVCDRLVSIVEAPFEHARVRAGCQVAMHIGGEMEVTERLTTELLETGVPELERAVWIVKALSSGPRPRMQVDLSEFRSATAHETFPVSIRRRAKAQDITAALTRIEDRFPEYYFDQDPTIRADERQEDTFTRELLVLALLGPSAEDEAIRNQLIDWVRGRDMVSATVRAPALHVFGLLAQTDAELAEELLRMAQQMLFDKHASGVDVLRTLSKVAGRHDLLLESLQHFFRNQDPRSENPLDMINQAMALDALIPVLGSDDELLTDPAVALVMERVLDETIDPSERYLFLVVVAASGNDSLVEIVTLVVEAFSDDTAVLADSIGVLSSVGAEGRNEAHLLLTGLSDRTDLPFELQRSIFAEIAQIGAPEARSFLEGRLNVESNVELRRFLQELLATENR